MTHVLEAKGERDGKLHPNLIGGRNVQTSFVYPPIPIRTSDWCAYFDGCEEDGNYGWGETEAKAIADLQMLFESGEFD